jgi:hypothetical protein
VRVEISARTTGSLCSKKHAQASSKTRKGMQDGQRAEAGQPQNEEGERIPDTAKEQPVAGEVVAVGPDARNRRS